MSLREKLKGKKEIDEFIAKLKTSSNRSFGSLSLVNIGNFPAPPYQVTQLTRTLLYVKPEREDLSLAYGIYAVGAAADNAVLGAAGVAARHKIFACGYTVDAAVQTGFRFNSANPRFCVRRTAGVFAQTFPNPVVSALNATLTLRVEGASNGDWWIQFVTEA